MDGWLDVTCDCLHGFAVIIEGVMNKMVINWFMSGSARSTYALYYLGVFSAEGSCPTKYSFPLCLTNVTK